jgi:hypothetical protein
MSDVIHCERNKKIIFTTVPDHLKIAYYCSYGHYLILPYFLAEVLPLRIEASELRQ